MAHYFTAKRLDRLPQRSLGIQSRRDV